MSAATLSPAAASVLEQVLDAMQEAEGMGGTRDTADYIELMNAIIREAAKCRRLAIENDSADHGKGLS